MKRTDLSKYDNSWYDPGSIILRISWAIVNSLVFNSYLPFPSLFKALILKLFGSKVGSGLVIKPKVNIKYPWNLSIGNNVWIGECVWIDSLASISIGNNVCISQGAYLLCGNHNYSKSTFDLIIKDIEILDGAWVGAKAIICPGVVMKEHSVLSVGSIATKELDAFSIYQGNPAKKTKSRAIY